MQYEGNLQWRCTSSAFGYEFQWKKLLVWRVVVKIFILKDVVYDTIATFLKSCNWSNTIETANNPKNCWRFTVNQLTYVASHNSLNCWRLFNLYKNLFQKLMESYQWRNQCVFVYCADASIMPCMNWNCVWRILKKMKKKFFQCDVL